jgi:hypothetical protein
LTAIASLIKSRGSEVPAEVGADELVVTSTDGDAPDQG